MIGGISPRGSFWLSSSEKTFRPDPGWTLLYFAPPADARNGGHSGAAAESAVIAESTKATSDADDRAVAKAADAVDGADGAGDEGTPHSTPTTPEPDKNPADQNGRGLAAGKSHTRRRKSSGGGTRRPHFVKP